MSRISELAPKLADELSRTLAAIDEADVARFRQKIARAKRIYIAGRGKSALQLAGFAMRLMHLGYAVHLVGEVTTPAIRRDDLLVIGSGSGRTPSLVGYARIARRIGTPIALVTASKKSPLLGCADVVIHLPASTPKNKHTGPPTSILPMGSLFEHSMGLLLELVVVQLMKKRSVGWRKMFSRHANLE